MAKPVRADEVRAESVDWLWRERIPKGMLTVIAGRPDQGKGLLAAHIAAEVSRGVDKKGYPDATQPPGKILYSAIEDSHGLMTKPRLEAAGANLNNILLWRFQVPSMLEDLMAIIKAKRIDLVVMDPVAAHLSSGYNRSSDRIREVLNPLTEFIEETGTAIVAVDHVIKRAPKGADPLSLIAGSGSGIPATARAAFLFGTDPADEDARMCCVAKLNLREKPRAIRFEIDTREVALTDRKTGEVTEKEVPLLVYDDELDFDPARMFESKTKGQIGRPPDKRAAAAEWLTNYLAEAGEPVLSGTIMEDAVQAGMSRKTLRRAAEDMSVVKMPPGGGRNCVWDLPEDIKDLMADDDEEMEGEVAEPSMELSEDDLEKLLGQGPVTADEVEVGDDVEEEIEEEKRNGKDDDDG